ncbi:MAG TPA: cupin domain-containing protein [Desulfosalsimonadaceae bacterium]|nr:cupin domain-containing protein [Desulfosalsimonadaceae bacterium]
MNAGKVGERIARIMAEKNLDAERLAEQTGLNRVFLQNIKDRTTFPSLGPMLKIARALGVRLGTLLDDQVVPDPLITRRDGPKEEIDMLPDKDKPVELTFYSLGQGKTDRHMEPFYIEIFPESAREKKLSSHEGEEFIVVVEGEVEVIYGNTSYYLQQGDTIYYNSVVPHSVSCRSREKAAIYAVLYIPE